MASLLAAQRMGEQEGHTDWTRLSDTEAMDKGGIRTDNDAGYSRGTASWHPAKWIWGLLQVAMRSPHVEFYSRTKVMSVRDAGDYYEVNTDRGTIRARYVLNATESHTASLFREFRGINNVVQSQAAWGPSDGGTMREGVALSAPSMFFSRTQGGVLFGSDRLSADYYIRRGELGRLAWLWSIRPPIRCGYFALDEGDYNALPAHLAHRVVHTVHGGLLDE